MVWARVDDRNLRKIEKTCSFSTRERESIEKYFMPTYLAISCGAMWCFVRECVLSNFCTLPPLDLVHQIFNSLCCCWKEGQSFLPFIGEHHHQQQQQHPSFEWGTWCECLFAQAMGVSQHTKVGRLKHFLPFLSRAGTKGKRSFISRFPMVVACLMNLVAFGKLSWSSSLAVRLAHPNWSYLSSAIICWCVVKY